MKKVIKQLITLANRLDQSGLKVEAEMVDHIIRVAKLPPFLEQCPKCDGVMKKGAEACKKCSGKS